MPVSSQDAASQTVDAVHSRRWIAITILRKINTIEVSYKFKHGGQYAAWPTLLASEDFQDKKIIEYLAKVDPQLANAQFSDGPEILPGWSLRLNLTADAQAYDLVLEDLADKTCGYAAVTDERGVIRQSKTIDCDI